MDGSALGTTISDIAAQQSHPKFPDDLAETLRTILADRVSFSLAEREQHGRGESYHASAPPDAVCHVLNTEEVSEIVNTA